MLERVALGLLMAGLVTGTAWADGDAKKGEQVFKKCQACHVLDKEQNRVGPHLKGIVGRPIAAAQGFNYSDSFKEAAKNGMVWTPENISKYLENPKDFIPKNKMAFPGLKSEDEREDVIAYMQQAGSS